MIVDNYYNNSSMYQWCIISSFRIKTLRNDPWAMDFTDYLKKR